jgi:uncharacterized protein YbjQ (UPF0145 family)
MITYTWLFLLKGAHMNKNLITTTCGLEGYNIIEYYGLVRGITVRSRSVIGNLGAGFQSIFGGNISIYTKLCEKARQEAFDNMIQHATDETPDANAILAMRYDANEVARGITEVICYGTAVRVSSRT